MPDYSELAAGWRPGTLLGQVPRAMRAELLGLGVEREYAAGAILMLQGSPKREALVLLRGFVKVSMSVEGQSVLLAIRAQGDVVGDLAAVSGQHRSATVTACTPILARYVLPETLRDFLTRNRVAGELLNTLIIAQLVAANRRRVEFATRTVRERLARIIVELLDVCGEAGPGGAVQLPPWFGQSDLADLIGASVDTVQRGLRDLRKESLIKTGYRSLTVLDPAGLAAVRAQPDRN
jgi:CRP/FNR family transcriptional regulator, cyclic AMP receptor protein